MNKLLKDEYDDYIKSFDNKPYTGLRINTNKITVEDFLITSTFKLQPIKWTNDGFYYTDEVTKHPYYYAGLYYVQEPSAMLPGEIIPIEENDIVLDACAAPGGKSLKILNKLNNTGLLISNDISQSRAKALLRNIERQGFSNFYVSANSPKDLLNKYKNTFDKIMLDAPCSGEGMFRKDPSLIKSWQEKNNLYYSTVQKELISDCIEMLKDGGQLLYSTCTFDESEDEEIIEYALDKYKDLKVIDIKMFEGFVKGKNNIGVKLYPHKVHGEGHFACLLKKGSLKKNNQNRLQKLDVNIDFFRLINKDFYGSLENHNDALYITPSFDTEGLRVLRSGLKIGELKNNIFKPSQALAMSLKANEFKNTVNLDYEQSIRYLKGETLKTDILVNDYVLVCYNNFPLGFGKTNNGIIKNLIDKGWIIR